VVIISACACLRIFKIKPLVAISAIQKRNQRYTVGSNNDMKNEKTIVVLAKFEKYLDKIVFKCYGKFF
jgi:hypothetical protein